MKLRNLMGAVLALAGIALCGNAFAADDGDIDEFVPITETVTSENALGASRTVSFTMRLLPPDYDERGGDLANHRWEVAYRGVGSEDVAWIVDPPRIGVVVSGQTRGAELSRPMPNRQFTDFTCTYTTEFGDYAMPLRVAGNLAGTPAGEVSQYYFYNLYDETTRTGLWDIRDADDSTHTRKLRPYRRQAEPDIERPSGEGAHRSNASYDLLNVGGTGVGYYVKTVDFDRDEAHQAEGCWRKTNEIGECEPLPAQLTVDGLPENPKDLYFYVWSEDESAVTVQAIGVNEEVSTWPFTEKDGTTSATRKVLRIQILKGQTTYPFGVKCLGADKATNLVMSSKCGYSVQTEGVAEPVLIEDYRTVLVKYSHEPVQTLSAYLGGDSREETYKCSADYATFVDTLLVSLTQKRSGPTKVRLDFSWKTNGVECTAFPTNFIAISAESTGGFREDNLLPGMEITIPESGISPLYYIYALGSSRDLAYSTGDGIKITPVPLDVEPGEIAVTNFCRIFLDGMKPVLTAASTGTKEDPVELIANDDGTGLRFQIQFSDSYRNVHRLDTAPGTSDVYTVRFYRGYGASDGIVFTNSNNSATNSATGKALIPSVDGDGFGVLTIHDTKYASQEGVYSNAWFEITNPEGIPSVRSYATVTVPPRPTVEAEILNVDPETDSAGKTLWRLLESDTVKYDVRFSLRPNTLAADGTRLWAFLEPANEAASNRTDGAFFAKAGGKGVELGIFDNTGIGTTQAGDYGLGGLVVQDGTAGEGSLALYNVVLRTAESYDSGEIFTRYEGALKLRLRLVNHKPEFKQLVLRQKAAGATKYDLVDSKITNGTTVAASVGINNAIRVEPRDKGNGWNDVARDLNAPTNEQIVVRWRVYEYDGAEEVLSELKYTFKTNNWLNDAFLDLEGFPTVGRYKVVANIQDKDMRVEGAVVQAEEDDEDHPDGWIYYTDPDYEEEGDYDTWQADVSDWGPDYTFIFEVSDLQNLVIEVEGADGTQSGDPFYSERQLPPFTEDGGVDERMRVRLTLGNKTITELRNAVITARVDVVASGDVHGGFVTPWSTNVVFNGTGSEAKRTKTFQIEGFDGTYRNGQPGAANMAKYTVKATILGDAARYYNVVTEDFRVSNVSPELTVTTPDLSDYIDNGEPKPITKGDWIDLAFSAADIRPDLTNMTVTCTISKGKGEFDDKSAGPRTLVSTEDSVDYEGGAYTNAFRFQITGSGTNIVKIVAKDKDGDRSEEHQICFFIEPTHNLILYPAKPTSPSTDSDDLADYFSASGIGYGRVWADSTLAGISEWIQTWATPLDVQNVRAYAMGYRAGEPEGKNADNKPPFVDSEGGASGSIGYASPLKDLDSFFYRWFAKVAGGNKQEGTWASYLPIPQLSFVTNVVKSQTVLPLEWPQKTGADATVFTDISALAIFSREWMWSDNMGDINGDGVPDAYVMKYKLVEDYTGGADLKNVNVAEDGKTPYCQDYLPQAESLAYSQLIPELTSYDNIKNATAFTPKMKLRGAAKLGASEDLNDATAEYLPNDDGTKTKNPAFVDGATPEKVYADPATCPTSTLSKVEYIAWSVYAAANGLDPEDAENWSKWSPERPTDPTLADSDNDGLTDGIEYYWWYRAHVGWLDGNVLRKATGRRYNPKNPGEGDLITSAEIEWTFDPIRPFGDATQDTDNDGLPDLLEFEIGTNPFDFDTDGDGLPDGWEVMFSGTDPTDPYTTEGQFDAARNYDGDAMAITSPALEAKLSPKPTKIDPLFKFALVDPKGDTDGIQWYVTKANPTDLGVKTDAEGAEVDEKCTLLTVGGTFYVTTAKVAVTADNVLATDLPKDSTWQAVKSDDKSVADYGAAAPYIRLMPTHLAIGTKLAGAPQSEIPPPEPEEGEEPEESEEPPAPTPMTCASLVFTNNVPGTMTAWPYGKEMKIVDEAGKELPGGFGFLAVGRYPSKVKDDKTAAPSDTAIAALPVKDDTICYLHSLVYQEFGFDPRTAWCAKSELNGRKAMGEARKPARTRAYTAYDEFLVYSFLVNTGMGDRLFAKLDDKAPEIARIWAAETTNPQGPNEPDIDTSGAGEGENARKYYGKNSDQGADTDLDGIPDGWELYVMAGPKDPMTDEYVFVGADCQFSPFRDYGADKPAVEGQTALMTMRENYAGTDSCNYYCKPVDGAETAYSTTITRPSGQAKWLNKFFPTDPWVLDTDGDGLTDDVESGKNVTYLGTKVTFWAGQFIYGNPADSGKLAAIPGGGLNPCAIDTDQDGLPDAWEAQFAGSKVYDGDQAAYSPDADGNQGNPLQGLVDGMDGTVPDAYNSVKTDGEFCSINFLGVAMPQDVDRDYDHDGLENWQEYLTGTMRCWRYDDPLSSWDYIPQSWYYDKTGAFRPWRENGKYLKLLGLTVKRGASEKDLEAQFWYETLFNVGGPAYNPHLVTETSSGAQYFTRVSNLWDPGYDKYYVLFDRIADNSLSGIWGYACYGLLTGPQKYVSCSPIKADSDQDGMDDYYELFHGLNPLLGESGVAADSEGPCDLVYDAWYNEGIGGYEWQKRGVVQNSPVNARANKWTDDPLATRGRLPRVNPDLEELDEELAEGPNANIFDFELFPWLNGLATADPDGDDIRNQSEAIMALLAPSSIWSHTDPTPLWMTDSSYTNSLVYRFFRLPATFGKGTVLPGPTFTYNGNEISFHDRDGYTVDTSKPIPVYLLKPFQPDFWGLLGEGAQNWFVSFEENEGYDSDHDAIADNDELAGAFKVASDPQDFDSPHRRQAMYFPGKDAALQSLPEVAEDHPRRNWGYSDEPAFAQYTVECWVMPETVDANVPQTVIERAVWTDWSAGGDQELLRRNFQIAIRSGLWYTKFDSGTETRTCVEVLSDVPAEAGKWTHVAATYGNGVLKLYVNGVAVNEKGKDGKGLKPEYGSSAVVVHPGENNAHTNGIYLGRGDSYWYDREYPLSAFLIGASFRGLADIGYHTSHLNVENGAGWSRYKDFFNGWVDEVRVWDGARDSDAIRRDMTKRYTAADVKANRDAFYGEWAQGKRRYDRDGNGQDVEMIPELRYHWSFDSVPGAANAAQAAKAAHGFGWNDADGTAYAGIKAPYSRPVGYGIGWWSTVLAGYGSVYDNPEYVTWIPNTLAHLPRFDGTTLDSFYWAEDIEGDTPGTYRFARTAEPVSRWTQYVCHGARTVNMGRDGRSMDFETTPRRFWIAYNGSGSNAVETTSSTMFEFTGRHLNQKGDDLVPLGGAYVRYVSAMWDEQGPSTAWEITGEDENANRLPDWWERYAIENYNPADPDNMDWNTLVDYNGMRIPAGQAYLYDLAKGYHAGADGNIVIDPAATAAFASTADEDKDGMPDYWEEMTGLHDGSTDLTVGHAWGDPDNDGLANISEYAVSTGALLGVGREIKPFGSTGRCTDGFVLDYFRRLADGRYLGEVQGIADHDMMEDAWEDLYDVTRANRWIWDALADRDSDGWSNYAECRAGTDPTKVRHAGIENSVIPDYPVPMVHVQVRMPEAMSDTDSIVIQAFSGSTLEKPDATWTAGGGARNATKDKIIGTNPGGIRRYFLNPGSISPGTVHLVFNDQNAVTEYYTVVEGKQQFTRSVLTGSGWYGVVDDRQRGGSTVGDLVKYDGSVVGWINYENGEVEVDYGCEALKEAAYVGTETSGAGENAAEVQTRTVCDLTRAYVRIRWQAALVKQGAVSEFYLTDADDGYVREGLNTFIAKSADGSLLGVARNVNVGWSKVEDLVIDLTAESAVFPRFEASVTNGEPAIVKIVRKSINGVPSGKIVMRKRGVEGQHLFTEADFVREGEFDLDWTTLAPAATNAGVLAKDFTEVEYEVTVDGETLDTFTKTFESVRSKPVAFSPTANQDNLLLSVSPTFRWTGPAGYTAFRLQVSTNGTEAAFADGVVYDSGARFLTALRDGTYEFAADCYLNEQLKDGQTCFWRVAMLNAKFTDAEDGWSGVASFNVAADSTRLNTGYGKAAVDVRYYGSNDCTRADVVVGLYRSADFTDAPVALQHLADGDLALLAVTNVRGCVAFTTNSVALFDGLKPGTYYAMAFIDANTNGVRDAWESWGYFNNIGTTRTDLYTPMTIEVVADRAVRGECVLFMEDTDVNRNGIPDCIEDMSGWSQVAPSVEDADLDGDGMPDDWEDLMGAGAAGFPTDDPETDAAYAAAGDVMAYAEVDRVLVTFEDNTQALVMKGVKSPTPGDLAKSCNNGNYEAVYAYGDKIGLGLPMTVSDAALRITATNVVKVALVHAQVYDEFGYDMRTANADEFAKGTAVNTKEFTALDKYLVWTYLRAIGYTNETEETVANWAAFTLKPGDPDQNRDGVADGWNLYVMFGPAFRTVAASATAPCTPWTGAGDARKTSPGGEGLTWVQEYDGGHYPTDPWSADTDRDGVIDYYAYQYHLKGGDAGEDFDGDGLSNYAEYLISEVFKVAKLDPENPKTDGYCVDYFRKMGDLYVGEIFTDHDQVDDVWEGSYEKAANRYVYDPDRDDDDDGWSNYAEFRAGTDPSKLTALGVSGANDTTTYTKNEYPIPTIEAKVIYNGSDVNLGKIVFKAWNDADDPDMTSAPDAIWTVGNGEAAKGGGSDTGAPSTETGSTAVTPRKYIGRKPNGVQSYRLSGGSIASGSITVQFLDQQFVRYDTNDVAVARNATSPKDANWYAGVWDKNGKLYDYRDREVGSVDYATGLLTLDCDKLTGSALGLPNSIDSDTAKLIVDKATAGNTGGQYYDTVSLDNSSLLVSWSAVNIKLTAEGTYYLADADAVNETARSHGHVREGLNTFICYMADSNGAYVPGAPFGVVRGVDVGWQGAKFTVELTETSAITPRVDIWNSTVSDRSVTFSEYAAMPLTDRTATAEQLQALSNAVQATSAKADAAKARLRVVRFGVNGMYAYRAGVGFNVSNFIDRVFDENGRRYLCEADFLRDGEFDIEWNTLNKQVIMNQGTEMAVGEVTNMTYLAVLEGGSGFETWIRGASDSNGVIRALGTTIERRFEKTKHAPQAENVDAICYGARPTFRWSLPDEEAFAKKYGTSYTAFKLKIFAEDGVTKIYDSGVRRAPVQDAKGVFAWTADASVGDLLATKQFFKTTGNYTWQVAMYNAKFVECTDDKFYPTEEKKWKADKPSALAKFSVAVNAQQEVNDHQYSSIDVAVKYAGPAAVIANYANLATLAGKVRVQAFATADFAGEPLSETVVTTKVADLASATANARLVGLDATGTYYIRAYIDSDGDRTRSAWESWGAAKTPVVLSTALRTAPIAGVWIEDCDVDNDWLPDAWEYVLFGEIAKEGADVMEDGKTLFTTETSDSAKLRLASISTGLEGASLTIFENGSWAKQLLGLSGTTSITFDDIRAAVQHELDVKSGTFKITSLTLGADGKVTLTVDAEVAPTIAGTLLTSVYDVTPGTKKTVKLQVYRKTSLAMAGWGEPVKHVDPQLGMIDYYPVTLGAGEEEVVVDVGVKPEDLKSGFYKIDIVE